MHAYTHTDTCRWMSELEQTRHELGEKVVELKIAHDALQPFVEAREGLLEEAKKARCVKIQW